MKTFTAKAGNVERQWYVVDATNLVLGRLAVELAKRLRGKHKPQYTPHVDVGDYIVVCNAGKIDVTGNKRQEKTYYWHTGYVGGLKQTKFEKLIQTKPTEALAIAVKGMLPRGPLGRAMFEKLKLYPGQEHPHQAQKPQMIYFTKQKAVSS